MLRAHRANLACSLRAHRAGRACALLCYGSQGEMLDNIAKQVERSANYVKGGTSAIVQAKNFQRNTRKWMTVAGVVVLIIIIIIILAVVRPWQYT
eukprot:363493-Chlamydomonas_euryale.AAC.10